MSDGDDRIGLAEYLTDLRHELSEAQARAVGDSLKLGVDEISVTLDIGCTLTKSGAASAGVKAKFWVLEFGEASAKGSLSSADKRTQRLTLKLKPRIEEVVSDEEGRQFVLSRGVDVSSRIERREENPSAPNSGS